MSNISYSTTRQALAREPGLTSDHFMTNHQDENHQKMAEMLAHLGDEVHLLTSLLEGGHLEPEEAYYKVKELWRQTKQAKRELFPDLTWDEKGQAVVAKQGSSE